jgi:DNA repair exonuclease SbcCD nuclease subunit
MEEDTKILPQNAVMPLTIPYTGDKTLQVIQYVDQARAQTTGALLANQGLDADKIMSETATRFNGIKDSSDAKVELIARNYAETGFRKLYEGIAWLASRFQDTQTEIRVLGKQLTVNPTSWKYKHHIQSNVGLGAGNNEKSVESLQGLYAIQQQLKANGSTLTDDVDIYNTLKRITDGLGFPRVDEFFNNPEEPEETLKAENELLNNMVMQLQQQVQQMQNPLAEAETIKAQSKAETDNKNAALKIAQLQEQIRQFDVETVQTANKQQSDTALAITKMELDNNTDLPGGLDA